VDRDCPPRFRRSLNGAPLAAPQRSCNAPTFLILSEVEGRTIELQPYEPSASATE